MKYRNFTKWDIPKSEKEAIPLIMEDIKDNKHSTRASKNPEQLANYYLDVLKMPLEYINMDFTNPKIEDKIDNFIKDLKTNKLKKTVIKRIGKKLKEVEVGEYKDKKKFIQELRVYVTLRYNTKNEKLKDNLLKKINNAKFFKQKLKVKSLKPEEIEMLIGESNSEYTARI